MTQIFPSPRWRGLRRALALPAALALLLPLAATTSAARPTTTEINFLQVNCDPASNEFGIAFTGGFADDFTVDAYFDFFAEGAAPEEGPPTMGAFSTTLLFADDLGAQVLIELGDYVELEPGSFGVVEPNGETVTLDVTYNAGDPQTINERYKNGNVNVRDIGFRWDLAPTIEADGSDAIGDFTFTDCFGTREEIERWQTTPHAFIGSFSSANLECEALEGSNGSIGFVFAGEFDDGRFSESFVDMFVLIDEEPFFGPSTVTGRTADTLMAVATLFSDDGASPEATLDAAFTEISTTSSATRGQDVRIKASETIYAVSGSLSLSTGETFDLSACSASSYSERVAFTPSNGPKVKGPAPANDVPAGALPLERRVSAQNGATALAPEVPASCDPVGRTLWYTVTGTGGPMTIDSAGSDFDTVVAVYDAAFNEVACSDDVPEDSAVRSLQGAATFESVAGATYYVQVGGFDYSVFFPEGSPEFGRVRLTVR